MSFSKEARGSASVVLPDEVREHLRCLIRDRGEAGAARLLEVGRATLSRAIAGLPMRRGSAVLITLALGALDDMEVA